MFYTQRGFELESWLHICRSLGVRTYVELGTDTGMSAKAAWEILKCDVVSVDIRNAGFSIIGNGDEDHLYLIRGDSHSEAVRDRICKEIFGGREVDAVFVDADHDFEAVKADHEMWFPLAKKVIGYHDIREFGSATWWYDIRRKYPSIEIMATDQRALDEWGSRVHDLDAGLGVIFKDEALVRS